MAEIMVAVGAVGLSVWLAALLLLRRLPHRSSSTPVAVPVGPSREEDLVRPAVTASGERTWIQADELVWHEIVAWPPQRKANARTDGARSA
jgi:hypothetical protein